MITCKFCHRPMDRSDLDTGYRRELVWTHQAKRQAGGNHTFVMAEPAEPVEWAHSYCITLAKGGMVGQKMMF